jgi:dihydrofolate reductase
VIGGTKIYEEGMNSDRCHRIYLTEIDQSFECDTFFPKIDFQKFKEVTDPDVPQEQQREGDVTYKFKIYERI